MANLEVLLVLILICHLTDLLFRLPHLNEMQHQ
jgi:hypothetical protein